MENIMGNTYRHLFSQAAYKKKLSQVNRNYCLIFVISSEHRCLLGEDISFQHQRKENKPGHTEY